MRVTPLAAIASVALLSSGTSAQADPDDPQCLAPFHKLLSNEVFSGYPAPRSGVMSKPAMPQVSRGVAHLYRTVIREEAKQGPNFAGYYTLIRIGCGAATVCPAIMNAKTGRVYFPPELKDATALMMDTGDVGVETLNYRRDSRLLVVIGAPNEDLKRDGMTYFEWRSGKLRLLRFVPTGKLCKTNRRAPEPNSP